jgi:hypothetical protein
VFSPVKHPARERTKQLAAGPPAARDEISVVLKLHVQSFRLASAKVQLRHAVLALQHIWVFNSII